MPSPKKTHFWPKVRIGFVSDVLPGFAFGSENYSKTGIRILRGDNVTVGKTRWNRPVFWSESNVDERISKYLLRSGDVVLGMTRTCITDGVRCAILDSKDVPSLLNQRVAKISPGESVNSEWLLYSMGSKSFEDYVISIQRDTTVPHISDGEIRAYPLFLPPISVQREVVDFLGQKTSIIDSSLSRLESMITAIEEIRSSLITQAVTKGLNSNVPMKDSGVDWIGEVPAHWDVSTPRLMFEEIKEKNSDESRTNFLSLVSGLGVIPYEEKGNVGNKMSVNINHYTLVNEGDFVINSMNFGIGSFGVSPYNGITSPAYVILRPNVPADMTGYLANLFEDSMFQSATAILGDGILELRKAIGWKHLKRQPIPVPPKEERLAICDFLNQQKKTLDDLTIALSSFVDVLKEHRTAIISAAVTGEINLRGM